MLTRAQRERLRNRRRAADPVHRANHLATYGWPHQVAREIEKARVASGRVRCARGSDCKHAESIDGVVVGGLIRPGQKWDLGHVDGDRFRYAGAEHSECNRATSTYKAARKAAIRAEKVRNLSREW